MRSAIGCLLLLGFPGYAANWGTWNGVTVGGSAGNVSQWDGGAIGTSAGNIGLWDGLTSPGGGGPITFIAGGDGCAGGSGPGTNATVTIDSTGGNFIAIVVAQYNSSAAAVTVTDLTFGNTFIPRTAYGLGAGGSVQSAAIWYAKNATVGASHQIRVAGDYNAICAMTFSGLNASAPYDQESGVDHGSSSTIQPGSITATGKLFIAGFSFGDPGTVSVNSSFLPATPDSTPYTGGSSFGLAMAYKIDVGAATENPTWSGVTAGSNGLVANMATFKQ